MTRSSNTVNIGLIQTACLPDPKANLKKTLDAAERYAKQGAQIILHLQELFRSQYFCQSEDPQVFSNWRNLFPARARRRSRNWQRSTARW